MASPSPKDVVEALPMKEFGGALGRTICKLFCPRVCMVCGGRFWRKKDKLEAHYAKHKCGEMWCDRRPVDQEKFGAIPDRKGLECRLCEATFVRPLLLVQHYTAHQCDNVYWLYTRAGEEPRTARSPHSMSSSSTRSGSGSATISSHGSGSRSGSATSHGSGSRSGSATSHGSGSRSGSATSTTSKGSTGSARKGGK